MVLQVIRLQGLLLDATECFAKFANKVVLLQVSRNVILPQQNVHLLHLLAGHPEGADPAHGELPLAEAAVAVELDESVVFAAHGEDRLHRGLVDLLPVQAHLLTQLLLEADQPLFRHLVGHWPVASPHQALLHFLLFHFFPLDQAVSTIHILGLGTAVQEPETPVAQTGVAVKPGELHGKLLLLRGLELCDVHRSVQHPELEVTVEAAVGTGPLWVDLEGTGLLRHHGGEYLGAETQMRIISGKWSGWVIAGLM